MTKRRVTLKDIAQAVDTSVSTVSLALRGDSRISESVRERIQETARQMGYQVDLTGSMLRTSNPRILGIAACFDQELHTAYTEKMIGFAKAAGYRVISENAAWYEDYAGALAVLSQLRVTTTIAINPVFSKAVHRSLRPTVVLGQTKPFPDCDLVRSTNTGGIGQLVDHLWTLGHRRVTYVDGPDNSSAQIRRGELLTACHARELQVSVIPGGNSIDDGFLAITSLLSGDSRWARGQLPVAGHPCLPPQLGSALVCYNDQCAQGAMVALGRAGVGVPDQLSVSGFDNSSGAASQAFDLTSIDRNTEEVARRAVELAILRAEEAPAEPKLIEVDSKLVIRSTTGPSPTC